MAVKLEFYADLNRGRLYASGEYEQTFEPPPLTAGDTVQLQVGLVTALFTGGAGKLNQIDVTGHSCKVAIGSPDSVLTSATLSVTTVDGKKVFSGTLPLNVAAITGLWGASEDDPKTRKFELEFSDGTGTQSIRRNVTLYNEVITSATVDPPAPEEALSKNEASALYLKKGVNGDGEGFTLVSPDGSRSAFFYLDNNGNFQSAPIT